MAMPGSISCQLIDVLTQPVTNLNNVLVDVDDVVFNLRSRLIVIAIS